MFIYYTKEKEIIGSLVLHAADIQGLLFLHKHEDYFYMQVLSTWL